VVIQSDFPLDASLPPKCRIHLGESHIFSRVRHSLSLDVMGWLSVAIGAGTGKVNFFIRTGNPTVATSNWKI
jgi:hypothetical protein